jgi:hypothetical protein
MESCTVKIGDKIAKAGVILRPREGQVSQGRIRRVRVLSSKRYVRPIDIHVYAHAGDSIARISSSPCIRCLLKTLRFGEATVCRLGIRLIAPPETPEPAAGRAPQWISNATRSGSVMRCPATAPSISVTSRLQASAISHRTSRAPLMTPPSARPAWQMASQSPIRSIS